MQQALPSTNWGAPGECSDYLLFLSEVTDGRVLAREWAGARSADYVREKSVGRVTFSRSVDVQSHPGVDAARPRPARKFLTAERIRRMTSQRNYSTDR